MFVIDLTIYPNRMEGQDYQEQDDIYSKALRAGRRTYFFDVRATRANDYYLTITESKKFTNDNGSFHYKTHQIYLYKEDFEGFKALLNETTDFVVQEKGSEIIEGNEAISGSERVYPVVTNTNEMEEEQVGNKFTDVRFEDI